MTETTHADQSSTAPIPEGYWANEHGHLVPRQSVAEIDQLRDSLVKGLSRQAEALSGQLAAFRSHVIQEVSTFVELAAERYGAKIGGRRGNVTLLSFDGRLKVQVAVHDAIHFGPELHAAKALIDEFIIEESATASDNIRALVMHAFDADKEGRINTARVLGLRRLKIHGEKWQAAMQAIADSVQVAHSKQYIRFYRRCPKTDAWLPIPLDAAAVTPAVVPAPTNVTSGGAA